MPPEVDPEEDATAPSAVDESTEGEAQPEQESSPDSTDESAESLLDVAKQSLDAESTEEAPAPSAEETETESGEEDPDATPDEDAEVEQAVAEEGPEDYSDVPFHKHPRFRQLLEERNTFREQSESLKASAEGYDNIQRFMSDNDVSSSDAGEALMIAANIKKDPAKALETLTGIVDSLRVMTGEALPNDLVQRVQSQNLSVDDALTLSRAQAQTRLAQEQAGQARRAAEQQVQQQVQQSVTNAVNSWEERIKTSDPDYGLKRDLVFNAVRAQLANAGPIQDVNAAVQVAQTAYEQVNETFKKLRPAPQPMQTATSARTGRTASDEPANLLDAAKRALAAHQSVYKM